MAVHFKPEFRQEVAELVVDKGYSIREAAEAMGVGKSTVDKWSRSLRKERNGEESECTPISKDLIRPPILLGHPVRRDKSVENRSGGRPGCKSSNW